MTRESEGRGVSSCHPIKTLPEGRITTEQKKNEEKRQPNQKKTTTGNKRQTKSHNKRNTTKPHRPTKREREPPPRTPKKQHAPKATEQDRPARYIHHQTPNYADDLENPNSTRRQVENGNCKKTTGTKKTDNVEPNSSQVLQLHC
ncbi:unnamed protein product [Polarella glacialis]|uniref:Uncharacterized protein n=1 Tax=Polarella glacialis TaxID=89957 RepID=A0A813F2T7_POLGL|nr:unnamed protein product [Polarella glacialis]